MASKKIPYGEFMGLDDKTVQMLIHEKTFINKEKLNQLWLKCIWYSTTTQSYAQRNKKYDSSIFANNPTLSPIANQYFKAYFEKIFEGQNIEYFKKYDDIEPRFHSVCDNVGYILIKDSDSLLQEFSNKIRNAIAHGIFNQLNDGSWLFIGQFKSEQKSKINFAIRVKDIESINNFMKKR